MAAARTAPTRRRNFGSNHGYYLDGTSLKGRGVTTILSNGFPKPALIQWAAGEAATCAVDERDIWEPLAARSSDAARTYIKDASNRNRDAAAKRGTEVHRLAERLQGGEEVTVPEELVGHVDSYLRFREEWQPTDEIIEGVVVNRTQRYMGTFDSVATLPGWREACVMRGLPDPMTDRVLYDIKTSKSGVFPETSLQLAAYRHAESYLPEPGGDCDEVPMPEVGGCAVLHIRADGYDLVPVRAGEREFRLFLYVAQVADFQGTWKDRGWSAEVVGDALIPPMQVSA